MSFSAATWLTMVSRAALQHLGVLGGKLSRELDLQALGGELDRRERVLDLVREAPRDFGPGGVALRLDQLGDVVEHHARSRRR